MKFHISKSELTKLIGQIQNIVPLKPTVPILSNLLIEASNDELLFCATDLTVGMRCVIAAKVIDEGAMTIPARRFFQLIKELPNVQVEVSSHPNETIEIHAGSSHFKLAGMRKDDFPSLPTLDGAVEIQFSQKELKDALHQTSFAVSREDNRHALTGLFLQIIDGKASFVGTDGKKLAKATLPSPVADGFNGSAIIPLKAVEEIQKSLEGESDVTLHLLGDKAALSADQLTIVTKLISGEYPDFQRIIPETSAINVSIHREELTSCLRQISLFTNEASQSARFTFSDGELAISTNHSSLGEGNTTVTVNYSGAPLSVAFSPIYMLEILKHCKDDTIQLGLTDPYNPGVITDSSGATFVIMPMRLFEN